jgi:3-hydroxyisobutyrate dehydrogenase
MPYGITLDMGPPLHIGYIGLGSQGGGIAEMVASSRHHLVVWARRPGVTDAYVEKGATAAPSPAALAARADIVGICVTGDADVENIVFDRGVLDAMRPRTVLVIQSTVDPRAVRAIGAQADNRGVLVVDAPVSGTGTAARQKQLLVMTGGSAEAVAAAAPLFETCAGTVVHCGGVGDAQIAKLINNAVFTANLKLIHDAFEVGEQIGITADALRKVLQAGSARSFSLDKSEHIFHPDHAPHSAQLLRKDAGLLASLTDALGIDTGALISVADLAVDVIQSHRESHENPTQRPTGRVHHRGLLCAGRLREERPRAYPDESSTGP